MDFSPYLLAETSLMPPLDLFPVTPAIAFHVVAGQLQAEAGSSCYSKFDRSLGEHLGIATPKYADTFVTGSAGRTAGFDFTIESPASTWVDDWKSPFSSKYALYMPNGADGVSYAAHETTIHSGMDPLMMVLHLGIPSPSTTRDSAHVFCYLEFNYLAVGGQYRLAIESGAPIRLQYKKQGGSTWLDVASSSELASDGAADVTHFLAMNNGQLRITTDPDVLRGIFTVHLHGMGPLRHAIRPAQADLDPNDPNKPGSLPEIARTRVSGQNGALGFEQHALRHKAISIIKSGLQLDGPVPNIAEARLIANSAGPDNTSLKISGTISQDANNKLSWQADISLPDAGDGLGSKDPPRLADMLCYIPPTWSTYGPPRLAQMGTLRSILVTERQVWDDQQRMGYTTGDVVFQNYDGRYTGSFGNFAFNTVLGNGRRADQRCRGLCGMGDEGIELMRADPLRIGRVHYSDFTYKLMRPIGYELIVDGWSAHQAVRILLMIGGINDKKYLRLIPDDGFPPYNPGYLKQIPILAKGTGNNPKWRFGPEETVLGAIMKIVRTTGYIRQSYAGLKSVPYYFFFDAWGNAHFEPYDPGLRAIKAFYNTFDPTGGGSIRGMHVHNSVANLRTGVTLQGQDSWTNELLNLHIPLDQNKLVVGYPYPVLERSPEYGTDAYMMAAGRTLAVQCSLPTQIVRMAVPFWSNVFAGDVVGIADDRVLGRIGLFVVIESESTVGFKDGNGLRGESVCDSILTCRSIQSDLIF